MSEEKFETRTVVTLEDAVRIARSLLRDMQYGYSIDDLVVETDSFMRAESFTAVEVKNDEETNLFNAAPEMYALLSMMVSPTIMMGQTMRNDDLRTAIEAVLKKARGEA